jgi:riboflavin synthase
MFTGIITDIGVVEKVETLGSGLRFQIRSSYDADSIAIGASIAHAGACLTVVSKTTIKSGSVYSVDVSSETLDKTTLGSWKKGAKINLERSLKIGDELGGHIVTGHVDGIAKVLAREDKEGSVFFSIEAPKDLSKFIAQKGSVALDGTSLTVNAVRDNQFELTLIPHTLDVTTWGEVQEGDLLNLEIDMMARYVARLNEASGH